MKRERESERKGLCFSFRRGECANGSGCRFSHDFDPNVKNPGICWNFADKGQCRYGSRCYFSHGKDEKGEVGNEQKNDEEVRLSKKKKGGVEQVE